MEKTVLKEELQNLYRVTLAYDFHKATYEKRMESLKTTYAYLLEETARICDEAEENMQEIAECIPDYIAAELAKETSRRKRELRLLDHKMNLVSWFIPFLGEMPSENAGELTGRIVEIWNTKMPGDKIGHSTYESIRGGFRRGLSCYITTAVCRSLGKPDDCYELMTLRDYRDNCLIKDEAGKMLVEEYYNIAPTIVKRIDRQENADEIYRGIWEEYLSPCIRMAEQGRNRECREKYTRMVRTLEMQYFYPKDN